MKSFRSTKLAVVWYRKTTASVCCVLVKDRRKVISTLGWSLGCDSWKPSRIRVGDLKSRTEEFHPLCVNCGR